MKYITSFSILSVIILFAACAPKAPEFVFKTENVRFADITSCVTATGTIEPVTKVEVGTQVSGIIDRLYVDYNSVVKKGQLIAELDRTNLIARLQSAQAQLASTKSDYEYQKTNLARMEKLHDKKFISDDEFETARLQFDKSEASYIAQQLSVNEAQTNLGYAYIYSPIDGVILSREVEEGQTVAATMSTPTLFTIAQDLTDMRVIADVDEADIGGVKIGQRVMFTVDAFPNDQFEGKVTQVRQQATTTSNVVTYQVVISAPNPDLKLMPGLTASVNIYTMEVSNVLTVSSKALRFNPTPEDVAPDVEIVDVDAQYKVWIKEDKTLRAVALQIGTTNGSLFEVLGGINEGTTIVNEVTTLTSLPQQGGRSPFMPGPPSSKKK